MKSITWKDATITPQIVLRTTSQDLCDWSHANLNSTLQYNLLQGHQVIIVADKIDYVLHYLPNYIGFLKGNIQ